MATPGNKPVVGDNAFSPTSGIHAAGVIENSDTFEPGVMTPEMVGAERKLVMGKHTGTHSVESGSSSAASTLPTSRSRRSPAASRTTEPRSAA